MHSFIPPDRFFPYLTWQDIDTMKDRENVVIIQPVGSIEQHGPHLPLATDSIFIDEIICEVLELIPSDIPIKRLPTQCMGFSPEHKSFDGTISLSSNLITLLIHIFIFPKISSLNCFSI